MSAIPSFLSPDASPPSRTTSLRSRPDATGATTGATGQPPRFADFLTASVVVALPGGDTGIPLAAQTPPKPDTGPSDNAATPELPMAALPGNGLPTPVPSLPVAPMVRATMPGAAPVTAAPVADAPVPAGPVAGALVTGEPVSAAAAPAAPAPATPAPAVPVAAGTVTAAPVATTPLAPSPKAARLATRAMPTDRVPLPDNIALTATPNGEPSEATDASGDPLTAKDDDAPGDAPEPAVATPTLPDTAVIPFAAVPTSGATPGAPVAVVPTPGTTPNAPVAMVPKPGATPDAPVAASPTPAILSAVRTTTGPVAASRVFASLRQATADTSSPTMAPAPSASPMAPAMPSSAGAPSIAVPAMPGATATAPAIPLATTTTPTPSANMPAFRLVPMPAAATPETAPPPLATLPSGPLSVTQPVQATATIGLLAGALRGLSTRVRDEDPLDDPARPTTMPIDPAALAATDLARPVTAASAPDQPPLDMTQAQWPQGMIDRIDRMREDAATADTRIQLSPDALGGIAVAIRQNDGATHIHFTADHAGTATMLADAQGQLARLAEDKGMRLGDVAVASGGTGGGTGGAMAGGSDMGQSLRDQRPPAQPAPVIPSRPRGPDTNLFGEEPVGSSAPPSSSTPSIRIA